MNLDGHHLTASLSSSLLTVNGGTLTLTGNGLIENSNYIGAAINGGKIIIENGSYISVTNAGFSATGTGSKVTMNGGTINAVEGGLNAFDNAEIEMNGGEIEISDNFGIATNGTAGRGRNTIVMNGGKVTGHIKTAGYEACGVYIANNDTFTMNGGEIRADGGTGLCMRGGEVTINDGTIVATGEPGKDGWIGDKKTVLEGISAIVFDEQAGYPGNGGMKLTVNGGTIAGVDHAIQILSDSENPRVFVTGGNFTPVYPEG